MSERNFLKNPFNTKDFVYNFFTENPKVIEALAKSTRKVSSIVSVCASGWPIMFKEVFPEAKVHTFDANPNQLKEFASSVREVTGIAPVLAKVGTDGFDRFLTNIKDTHRSIDLLFISNIADYLKRSYLSDFVELVTDCEIQTVVFSALGQDYSKLGVQGNAAVLAELFEEEDYRVTRVRDNTYEVKEYYIARLEDEILL